MLLSKQPGDTGIYATATPTNVRLYYVLDRVLPLVSRGAAAAKAAGIIGSDTPDMTRQLAAAPACVPRQHLRLLHRLRATGIRASRSGAVLPGGHFPSASSAAAADSLQPQHQDAASLRRWGSALIPFHTVPCSSGDAGGVGGGGASDTGTRPLSSRSVYHRSSQDWMMTSATSNAEDSAVTIAGVSSPSAGGYYSVPPGPSQQQPLHTPPSGRLGGTGGVRDSSVDGNGAGAASLPAAPTALSLSCATDTLLFFVANAAGHSWIGRSDTTALSPLRVSTSLQVRRHGAGSGNGGGGGTTGNSLAFVGAGTVASTSLRPPRPFSAGFNVPGNGSFRTHSFASSERAVTPPNTSLENALPNGTLLDSDLEGATAMRTAAAAEADDEAERVNEGSAHSVGQHHHGADGANHAGDGGPIRRDDSGGATVPSYVDGLDIYTDVPSSMTGLPTGRLGSRTDRVVTASGWDPRNSAILVLGRRSGVVQLLDVEYVVGSLESTCCSSTTNSDMSDSTAEPFITSARGAATSITSGGHGGGARLIPYSGADHLSFSVIQQREMVGPVTALDWMPQSHLTVLAARRRDGLGCYAELLDLRASHDGVTYLGAPPEVFGVPVYTRGTDGAAPSVLCSAEHLACHPSQRYVASVGTARMRDIVQLWDVRMTTRPVAYQVYARAGYTSLCWSSSEVGVVLGTTRDGGLRAHHFDELAPRGAGGGNGAVVYNGSTNQNTRGGTTGGGGAGLGTVESRRNRRRRGTSSNGLLSSHPRTGSGGEQDVAERWGTRHSSSSHHQGHTHHLNSGCSGTEAEAEDDFLDDSGSLRSGVSYDGAGTALSSTTEGSNALVHVNVKAQSALKCRLPARVPAAAVAWVCHPTSQTFGNGRGGNADGEGDAKGGARGVHADRTRRSPLSGGAGGAEQLGLEEADSDSSGCPMKVGLGGENSGGADAAVLERGFRTDLSQMLLQNGNNGELYTQVYNPRGSTVTILNRSTALVAAGPNAFLARSSASYKAAAHAYDEALMQRLEDQAAAVAAAEAATADPSLEELRNSARGAGGGTAAASSGEGGALITSNGTDAPGPRAANSSNNNTSSGRAVGRGGTFGATAGGSTTIGRAPAKRTTDRTVDLMGFGLLLDEEDDEEDEENSESEEEQQQQQQHRHDAEDHVVATLSLSANAEVDRRSASQKIGGNCNDSKTNKELGGCGAADSERGSPIGTLAGRSHSARGRMSRPSSLPRGSSSMTGTADHEGTSSLVMKGSSANLSRKIPTQAEAGAAAPGARDEEEYQSGRRDAEFASAHRHGTLSSVSLSRPMSPHHPAGDGATTGVAVAASFSLLPGVPQELSFAGFHRIERERLVWRRLRAGFSCDPVRNLRILLKEGIDREAYTTFLYGCCAALLLYPSAIRGSSGAGVVDANGVFSFPILLGERRSLPGLLELLVSERRLRAQLGLQDAPLSTTFRLSPHHQNVLLSSARPFSSSETSASSPDPQSAGVVGGGGGGPGGMHFPAPSLLPGLPSAMDRGGHKHPSGFLLNPFEASGMRGGRLPTLGVLGGPPGGGLRNSGGGVPAGGGDGSASRGLPGQRSSSSAAAKSGNSWHPTGQERPSYTAAIGMLRHLVLQSMGWIAPPLLCQVEEQPPTSSNTIDVSVTAPNATGQTRTFQIENAVQPSPSSSIAALLRRPSRQPAEYFLQGDGLAQHSLQEALERRVAVLVFLGRLDGAAELLTLYSTYNPRYPSIALTLSAACGQTQALLNLTSPDCPGVTFWVHLMLTYVELLIRQQRRTSESGGASTPAVDRAVDGTKKPSVTREAVEKRNATGEKASFSAESSACFDCLFTIAEQKKVVVRLLERYPRLELSDKIALAAALLLPSHYHAGHLVNLTEVLQLLVRQQYRPYTPTSQEVESFTNARPSDDRFSREDKRQNHKVAPAGNNTAGRTGSCSVRAIPTPPSQHSPTSSAALQQQRQDVKPQRGVVPLSPLAAPLPLTPTHPSASPQGGQERGDNNKPSHTAAANSENTDYRQASFTPICGCSLLLVTAVEAVSTDCGALQRYADESADMQTSLCYTAVFGSVHSSTFRMWREAYRQLLNEHGLAMWRSKLDLQCVKLLKARAEVDETAGSSGGATGFGVLGLDALKSGGAGQTPGTTGAGIAGLPSADGLEGPAGVPKSASTAASLLRAGAARPKGFAGGLGSLGVDLGTTPTPSAVALMSTQTAMMMKRTLKGFAQTTATSTAERERSMREAAAGGGTCTNEQNRTVELRCNCGQAMHSTAPNKSSMSAMTSTNLTRKQLIPCGNPECRQWQTPMCTVCGERMEHRATELPPECFFAWCSVCLHGGHWRHLREWFRKHTKCAVENCPCHCCDNSHLT